MTQNPPGNHDPQHALTALRVDPAKVSVEIGTEIKFTVFGMYAGVAGEQDISSQAQFTSEDPALLAPVAGSPGTFKALAAGDVALDAKVDTLHAASTVTVLPGMPQRMPMALALSMTDVELALHASAMITATLSYNDGTSEDVTAAATWTSSDPAIVTVSLGQVTRATAGEATITATHLGLEARVTIKDPPAPPCSYPTGATTIALGATIPNVSWTGAYLPDGTQTNFSLEDIHCGAQFADKTVIAFVVGAGWCGPCSQYAADLNMQAAGIEAAGAQIIYVEAEDESYRLASSAYANSHLGHIIGSGPGIRAGDGETQPMAGTFRDSSLTTQFPTAFVVRKSDMKIIVVQADWNDMLPYAQIARHPDADWSHPNQPPQAPNCGMADEEAGEPNDTAAQATAIQAGSFMGGICNGQPDFYQIDYAGSWTFDLEFTHAVGDLDVVVWDAQANRPVQMNGRNVGSESGDDNESFDYSGPALVRVYGYQGATSPYVLRLTTH